MSSEDNINTTTYVSPLKEIEDMINIVQPLYSEMNSKFSKSYLMGSMWYVGDDLLTWWRNCNNIRYYSNNIRKFMLIVGVIKIHCENQSKKI